LKLLKYEAELLGIKITDEQLNKFKIYMDYLKEYNAHTNLTSITDTEDIIIKHFFDSIVIQRFIDIKAGDKIIDIGTGAGFPGVPLKICNPSTRLTLLDGLNKRITFLKNLLTKLDLSADVIHGRAEELSLDSKFRENFDFVTSRAVAPLNILSEYCIPYLKKGGCFVALKGPEVNKELESASKGIKLLGGELINCFSIDLPLEKGKRSILVIKKKFSTSKLYPRKNSKITSLPL